jgi:hypothetical protein
VGQFTFDAGDVSDDNARSGGVARNGTAQFTSAGKFNRALHLPGDRYVSLPYRPQFSFLARGSLPPAPACSVCLLTVCDGLCGS